MGKITSFTDLIAWQEANRFAVFIYSLSKGFPKEEKFSLTDQLRRAAVSVSSNIAEGFARNSRKDKLQFYTIAKGSLFEVHSQSL
ncbi:MAG: four helix bundle protein, partial [bacterium]|nr:four helix bundle protein [bacterium]